MSADSLAGQMRVAAARLLAILDDGQRTRKAMNIVSLEEVLDRQEGWRRGRHSGDYWVIVFGDPEGARPWSWRFEGHHLSVTMTVTGQDVSPPPSSWAPTRPA